MPVKVIRKIDSTVIYPQDIRKYYLNKTSNTNYTRLDAVDDEILVPIIYALTGTNLICDIKRIDGINNQEYSDDEQGYIEIIACIDYRQVKNVRKKLVSSIINDTSFIVNDISYIKYEKNTNLKIPTDFIDKKNMLADVQSKLSNMIKESIERDNKLGLIITN